MDIREEDLSVSDRDSLEYLRESLAVKSKGEIQMEQAQQVNKLFEVHILNENGKGLAKALAGEFHGFLCSLEGMCGADGREMAIVRTKLEETCFFAKKALASRAENQA